MGVPSSVPSLINRWSIVFRKWLLLVEMRDAAEDAHVVLNSILGSPSSRKVSIGDSER